MLNSENSLLPKVSVEEKEKIKEMIEAKKSFCVVGANNTSTVAGIIEGMVETAGFRCRVYTSNRSLGIAAALIPTGITQVTGLFTALGIAAHNLVTAFPDYQIVKCLIDNQVLVLYDKKD